MKIAVSNIAWDIEEHEAVLSLLRERGVRGIEIAPTKLWPDWRGADATSAAHWRQIYAAAQFDLPSMQAILFGKPDLRVFGNDLEQEQTLNHIALVAELAAALGVQPLVFGSPANRKRGELSADEAFSLAIPFFREAGRRCAVHGVWLCLEPLPEAYGSNFITNWREAVDLVVAVDTPGFGLHLDTGCIYLAGDDPVEAVRACKGITRHFHVSEPHLVDLSKPMVDHRSVGSALCQTGYTGWVSIEMRKASHPLQSIAQAVNLVNECYHNL